MSKELMYILITKMHIKLNELIVVNDYNLLDNQVQHYSRRLDKVLDHYNKTLEKSKTYTFHFNPASKVFSSYCTR